LQFKRETHPKYVAKTYKPDPETPGNNNDNKIEKKNDN